MKGLLLFIFFFLVGIFSVGGYYWWKNQSRPLIVPTAKIEVASKSAAPTDTFSVENAPPNSIRGIVATFSGEVQWQSRVATEPAKLENVIPIQQGEKLSTGNTGKITINFDSFGSVNLSPKTEISIIQTLPVNFVFDQASGSAQFISLGTSPFSVRTLRLLSTISTGSATVNVDEKTNFVTFGLKSGLATIAYNDDQFISQILNLKAGQKFVFDSDGRLGKISHL